MKKYLKMISPFNSMEDMPTAVYTVKKLLAFLFLYFSAAVLGEAIIIGSLCVAGYDPLHGVMPSENMSMLIQYYGFIAFLLAAILYCKRIEKHSFFMAGFGNCAGKYMIGSGIAVVLLIIIVTAVCMLGGISYVGICQEIDGSFLVALLVGFMIQGAAEEALCRGFLMKSLLKKMSAPMAVLLSSTAFAFPHFSTLFEAELQFALVGVLNLYLVSAIFSLLVLNSGNIWGACGLHSIWNFALYGVLGLTLSGSESVSVGLICFRMNASDIMNGGVYGLEASIITTAVLSLTAIVLYIRGNQRSIGRNVNEF